MIILRYEGDPFGLYLEKVAHQQGHTSPHIYEINALSNIETDVGIIMKMRKTYNIKSGLVALSNNNINYRRYEWFRIFKKLGLACPSIIKNYSVIKRKNIIIGDGCLIEEGTVIEEGCSIGPNTYIGAGAIIKAGTALDHSCWIESGVIIGAQCTIGHNVILDMGVVVNKNIKIGNDCEISKPMQITNSLKSGTFYSPLFSSEVRIITPDY